MIKFWTAEKNVNQGSPKCADAETSMTDQGLSNFQWRAEKRPVDGTLVDAFRVMAWYALTPTAMPSSSAARFP
jgi:hypothetical protein